MLWSNSTTFQKGSDLCTNLHHHCQGNTEELVGVLNVKVSFMAAEGAQEYFIKQVYRPSNRKGF